MNVNALRAQYRSIRNASVAGGSFTAQSFDDRARRLAHELADGEDMTAEVWVRAAKQVAAGE